MANIKTCNECGKIGLDQYDFNMYWQASKTKHYYRNICIECDRHRNKQYRANRKELRVKYDKQYYMEKYIKWIIFLKELGYNKCSECGYDKCFAAIDFHHTDPDKKESSISDLIRNACNEKNKQILLNELKNCIVLCSNCHRELHSTLEGLW